MISKCLVEGEQGVVVFVCFFTFMGDIIWTIYQNTDVFENAVQFIIHINADILIQGRYE